VNLGLADKAKVDDIVKLYLGRTRQRAIAATPQELAARLSIINDIAARNAARLKTTRDRQKMVMKTGAVFKASTDDLKDGGNGTGGFAALGGAGADEGIVPYKPEYVQAGMINFGGGAVDPSKVLPQVQPVGLKTEATPIPTTPAPLTSKAFSFAELAPYFDIQRGFKVAAEVLGGVLESAKKQLHKCYRFVKQALIDAGVIDAPNPQSTGKIGLRPGLAQYFNADVVKNPKILEKMGYRRVKGEEVGLTPQTMPPAGSLMIYGAKCWFADYEDAGHAELVVTPDDYEKARREKPQFKIPPLGEGDLATCYYDCKPRSMAKIRKYGAGENACLRVYVPVRKP
jgi:hypothetical protein